VGDSGRVIRRAVKRRHAHPLVSRLEKDYLSSPTYHRSSPNLYQPNDVVGGVGGVATGVCVSVMLLLLSLNFLLMAPLLGLLLSLNFLFLVT
jgi:hypothetical protein